MASRGGSAPNSRNRAYLPLPDFPSGSPFGSGSLFPVPALAGALEPPSVVLFPHAPGGGRPPPSSLGGQRMSTSSVLGDPRGSLVDASVHEAPRENSASSPRPFGRSGKGLPFFFGGHLSRCRGAPGNPWWCVVVSAEDRKARCPESTCPATVSVSLFFFQSPFFFLLSSPPPLFFGGFQLTLDECCGIGAPNRVEIREMHFPDPSRIPRLPPHVP